MFIQDTLKYIIAGTLAIINFLGLYAINDLHDNSSEPPSTLVVQTTIHQLTTIIPSEEPQVLQVATTLPTIQFKHGDVSWLPDLAIQAGWEPKHLPNLEKIILRESGGCPNRRGGDVVDKNCNLIRVSEWNHRSDTGLLQINGVNYNLKRNKWAALCLKMNICTQEPLLDPLTNLKAGKLLYDLAGWSPWDPCTWGKKWAHKCNPQYLTNE